MNPMVSVLFRMNFQLGFFGHKLVVVVFKEELVRFFAHFVHGRCFILSVAVRCR